MTTSHSAPKNLTTPCSRFFGSARGCRRRDLANITLPHLVLMEASGGSQSFPSAAGDNWIHCFSFPGFRKTLPIPYMDNCPWDVPHGGKREGEEVIFADCSFLLQVPAKFIQRVGGILLSNMGSSPRRKGNQ